MAARADPPRALEIPPMPPRRRGDCQHLPSLTRRRKRAWIDSRIAALPSAPPRAGLMCRLPPHASARSPQLLPEVDAFMGIDQVAR